MAKGNAIYLLLHVKMRKVRELMAKKSTLQQTVIMSSSPEQGHLQGLQTCANDDKAADTILQLLTVQHIPL